MFYNKPNGMAHYLKSADYPVHEAVVALVDPDMIFMSPLTPFVGKIEGGREGGRENGISKEVDVGRTMVEIVVFVVRGLQFCVPPFHVGVLMLAWNRWTLSWHKRDWRPTLLCFLFNASR